MFKLPHVLGVCDWLVCCGQTKKGLATREASQALRFQFRFRFRLASIFETSNSNSDGAWFKGRHIRSTHRLCGPRHRKICCRITYLCVAPKEHQNRAGYNTSVRPSETFARKKSYCWGAFCTADFSWSGYGWYQLLWLRLSSQGSVSPAHTTIRPWISGRPSCRRKPRCRRYMKSKLRHPAQGTQSTRFATLLKHSSLGLHHPAFGAQVSGPTTLPEVLVQVLGSATLPSVLDPMAPPPCPNYTGLRLHHPAQETRGGLVPFALSWLGSL